jgi:glutamate formiminotransferase/formiminotetrahydrofolate cyclodeaminase
MTADFYLQLENFSAAQVLENRMAAALSGAPLQSHGKLAELVQPFLDAVAAPTATPGGGSVSALAGALAASLGQMVAGLSRKKKAQAAYVDELSAAVDGLRRAADLLAQAIDRDAASYDAVLAAMKRPKDSPEDARKRETAIQQATRGAAEIPLQVAEAAAAVHEKLGQLEAISSPSMISDLRVAKLLAAAGARGALENVAINLESISDAAFVAQMKDRAAAVEMRLAGSMAAKV